MTTIHKPISAQIASFSCRAGGSYKFRVAINSLWLLKRTVYSAQNAINNLSQTVARSLCSRSLLLIQRACEGTVQFIFLYQSLKTLQNIKFREILLNIKVKQSLTCSPLNLCFSYISWLDVSEIFNKILCLRFNPFPVTRLINLLTFY